MSLWVHKFIQDKQCCEGPSLHGVVSEFKTLAFNACKSDPKEGTDVRIGFFEFGDGGWHPDNREGMATTIGGESQKM